MPSSLLFTLAEMLCRYWRQLIVIDLALISGGLAAVIDKRAGGATECANATSFFPQLVDHFSGAKDAFQQQYQIIDQFYKPGGPILYQFGAEGPMSCLVSLATSCERLLELTELRNPASYQHGPRSWMRSWLPWSIASLAAHSHRMFQTSRSGMKVSPWRMSSKINSFSST
jgi:hypothetical protein